MTPKRRAKDLVDKYSFIKFTKGKDIIGLAITKENAKQSALICVDEVIKSLENSGSSNDMHIKFSIKHWQWTKQEINKL